MTTRIVGHILSDDETSDNYEVQFHENEVHLKDLGSDNLMIIPEQMWKDIADAVDSLMENE